ncbi:MAG: YeeE/YedE family protein [Methylococcales bacterium]|nr:YeeE/YedE family protein [Methylococcales bacterium]
MKQNFMVLLCGVIFGIGLSLSQMINPNKVLDFLDISGNWDPSLLFVMIGALAVTLVSFKWVLKRPVPLLAERFHVSNNASVDKPLLLGAAIFGIGWGMSGYCPGPAVGSLGLLSMEALFMVASIYTGFFAYNWLLARK